jgi:hypothetical protein
MQEAMRKIAWLEGKWQGSGTVRMPEGTHEFIQQENVSFKANGSVLLIEGLGLTKAGGATVHQALALISFDETTGQYQMRAVKGDGVIVDADTEVSEGIFKWRMPVANGAKVEYTLKHEGSNWVETGSYSPDGKQWFPFFSMNLSKQEW